MKPYLAALLAATKTLVELIEESNADPQEYIPSRIRHAAREARVVIDYVQSVEREDR